MNILLNILSAGKTWIILPALIAAVCALPPSAAADYDSADSATFSLVPGPCMLAGLDFGSSPPFSLDPSPCVRAGSDSSDSAHFNTCQLRGDVNCDCTVNILDLIAVRNKLRQDPDTAENCRANVNHDNSINILDLLEVRNRLRTSCAD